MLFYGVDSDAGERHEVAASLLVRAARGECVQPLQSYAEFFHATTRKGRLSPPEAGNYIRSWRRVFRLSSADIATLDLAMRAVPEHGLAFWDAMLWATAKQAGCRILFTEDFQDGRTLDGVMFVNPFLPANARYVDLALPPA